MGLQSSIVDAIEAHELAAGSAVRFRRDVWQKDPGERLQGQGLSAWDIQTSAFDAHIRDESARWAKVIKARNITME